VEAIWVTVAGRTVRLLFPVGYNVSKHRARYRRRFPDGGEPRIGDDKPGRAS
jgi:hypothetical protein